VLAAALLAGAVALVDEDALVEASASAAPFFFRDFFVVVDVSVVAAPAVVAVLALASVSAALFFLRDFLVVVSEVELWDVLVAVASVELAELSVAAALLFLAFLVFVVEVVL